MDKRTTEAVALVRGSPVLAARRAALLRVRYESVRGATQPTVRKLRRRVGAAGLAVLVSWPLSYCFSWWCLSGCAGGFPCTFQLRRARRHRPHHRHAVPDVGEHAPSCQLVHGLADVPARHPEGHSASSTRHHVLTAPLVACNSIARTRAKRSPGARKRQSPGTTKDEGSLT